MSKKKSSFKCKLCEFYDKDNDCCEVKDVEECSKKKMKDCKDFLVADRLVNF